MQLDIVIPTHNRAARLRRLLDSLHGADRPDGLSVRVIVVDNASTDATRDVVMSFGKLLCGDSPVYLFEPVLGRTSALNRGLRSVSGDLVGFLDDDERVDAGWLTAVFSVFRDPDVDFISGPCKPDWGADPPTWLPRSYPAVIGWIESGGSIRRYGPGYAGIMMGGNGVLRRECLDRVGPFTVGLGKIGATPYMGDDAEFFERLMETGARGYYIPDLVIYHYVPPERLTKRYHRRWCFCRGISLGRIDRARPQKVVYLFGAPRYMFGSAARAIVALARGLWRRRDPEQVFTDELRLWDLAGFLWGKHLSRPLDPQTLIAPRTPGAPAAALNNDGKRWMTTG